MIIDNKERHVIEESDFLTIESKVNEKKLAKLYGLLSNIYRNKIGAIVREYASNAYDANVEARNFATLSYKEIVAKYSWVSDPTFNMDEAAFNELKKNLTRVSEKEPVIVGILEKDNQPYFYVKDYGIGLSPERMANIYFNYLDSTKEDNDDEIGGFGIGSKSALSYTHTFYIDTVYNGIQYMYIMSKNAKGIPQGQLLYKSEYDASLENGTVIKVKIKETGEAMTFVNETIKQLSYMDNLYFDAQYFKDNNYPGVSYNDRQKIDEINDFKLYRGSAGWLKKSQYEPYNEMHLCLGKISYTIDWTELGMPALNSPISIQFEVGELEPTPSRESIVYTNHSIKVIKDKIESIQAFFAGEYAKLYSTTDDLGEFMELRDNTSTSVTVGGITMDLDKLLGYTEARDLIRKSAIKFKPFEDAGFKYIPGNNSLFDRYRMSKKISYNSAKLTYPKYDRVNSYSMKRADFNYVYDIDDNTSFTFHNNAYLLEEVLKSIRSDINIITKEKKYDYSSTLALDSYYKKDKKKQDEIKAVYERELDKYISSKSINYKDNYPNPNWHHSFDAGNSRYSPKKKRIRLEGKIFCYKPGIYSTTFNQSEMELQDIANHTGIVMYDEHSNKAAMLDAYMLLQQTESLMKDAYINEKALLCISVSKANYKIVERMENTKTPAEVFTKVRTFRRISTAMFINDRFRKLADLSKIDGCYDKVDVTLRKLETYLDANFLRKNFSNDVTITRHYIDGAMLVAKKHNMIDEVIVKDLEFLEDYYNGLGLLKSVNDTDFNPAMVEFLKLKGKRVSNKFYLKPDKL